MSATYITDPPPQHNIQCVAGEQSVEDAHEDDFSRATEPRFDPSARDAECMQPTEMVQPGACAAILALADDTRITATQYRVFALIGKGYSKRADMAAKIGKTVVTVARAIDALLKLNLIKRTIVKGKASKLRIHTRIIEAARVLQEMDSRIAEATAARITDETSITHDTTTRITHDTTDTGATGLPVDNPGGACIGTGARAQTQPSNTTASDQIRSDQAVTITSGMISALARRAGDAADATQAGLLHAGALTRFIRGGCTWEDIEFATDKLAASFRRRGKQFVTWDLLEEHVIEIRNRRVAGLPPPAPPVPFRTSPRYSSSGPYRANGISPLVAVG